MYKILMFFLCSIYSILCGNEFISEQTLNLANSNNEFAFNLYNNLEKEPGNICFSPFSISSALAMVYNGARDETKTEMAEVLKFSKFSNSMNESFSVLNRFFAKTSHESVADLHVDIVNSLWIQSGFQIQPQFLDEIAKYFKVSVQRVDFLRQREIARRDMNYYVKEKTKGKITDLVQPNDLLESTKLVLLSSLYMKAKWKRPFDKHLTKMAPFFVSPEKTIQAEMMQETGSYRYYKSSEKFAAIEIPYIHLDDNLPDLHFLVLLPDDHFGMNELEKKMNTETFKNILSHLESEQIALFLPKFTFTMRFSLKNTLINMGMKSAFNNAADFSGITGKKDLQIGEVSHKVFIAVDENGTEAAAATAVSMNMTAIFRPKEPYKFLADHPFLFLIFEKLTGTILFYGRVVNPVE